MLVHGDRASPLNPLARIAGRPLVAPAVGVAELERRGLEPETAGALEEKAEPRAAAEFAVGDRSQSRVFLGAHRAADGVRERNLIRRRIDSPFAVLLEGVLQRRRPQQAADGFGAKRWSSQNHSMCGSSATRSWRSWLTRSGLHSTRNVTLPSESAFTFTPSLLPVTDSTSGADDDHAMSWQS